MTIKDAEVLISFGYIKKDQSDFENAKALGIDFNCAIWDTSFIVKCIAHGKGLVHAMQVIDFLRGAKLGCYGIMTYKRAEWLNGFAVALSQVKLGDINLGKIKSKRKDKIINFKTWLYKQKDRDDPVGDLARDAIQDPKCPLRLEAWKAYLTLDIDACESALNAFERAKTEFKEGGDILG